MPDSTGRQARKSIALPPALGSGNTDMYVVMRAQGGDPRAIGRIVVANSVKSTRLYRWRTCVLWRMFFRGRRRGRDSLRCYSHSFPVWLSRIATVGIYGVVSYSMARRTKRIWIAHGARRARRRRAGLVMKQGAG